MDAMLHALGGILLRAVPTFLLIVLLHFYLKSIFFKPLKKVLEARYDATEGARKLAEQSLAMAATKTAQYQKSLADARATTYQAQEKTLKELQAQQAAAVAEARRSADAEVKQAKASLAVDVAAARTTLAAEADAMADRIADTLLKRSAA